MEDLKQRLSRVEEDLRTLARVQKQDMDVAMGIIVDTRYELEEVDTVLGGVREVVRTLARVNDIPLDSGSSEASSLNEQSSASDSN